MTRIVCILLWTFLGAISGPSAPPLSWQTIGRAEAFAPIRSRRCYKPRCDGYPAKQLIVPTVSSFFTPPVDALPTSTSLASAKVLPFVYTGASGALLYKAAKLATHPAEAMVLAAVAALSLFNLGPGDNARLASAKRAYKKTQPASAGPEKQARQAALTWRKAVRIKIVGQVIGLARMLLAKEPRGVMKGAAWVMGATMAFLMTGGGSSRHDDDGNWKPIPESALTGILVIDAVLFGAALVAGECTGSSASAAALVYTVGVTVGSLEGIPQFIKAIRGDKS
mmetsp:Transcript_21854/g.51833  ORF Transcript_21854/g.51833 Transcript_21854/m.51833 type:complete len:281 (+) Transcript_21854:120-962(+)|eukprot:CAMPEP_0172387794 /NCGR_PEP_ID=MMETSP1061-20121228/5039_1 /TAXON_ID=37318 /ORGANISM="Pseudo-nitzschia pungens, Strain cf. pungens" /LENGTH=280 /DNA_ID=CAMNT_0013117535 /DNA_START=49 /DNA_END=891 /DNA_ORIENTATION=+